MSFKHGNSYIKITSEDKDHILSKALLAKGYNDFELIFAPKWSCDFGWTIVKGLFLPTYLAPTKKESLNIINNLNHFDIEINKYNLK